MKKYLITLFLAGALLIVSCGQKAEEAREAMEAMKNLPQAAKQAEQNINKSQAKLEERKKKGDTLALPYTELQKYLPASISGYTSKEPSGEQMTMGEFSMSQAERRYEKDAGGGQGSEIKVQLVDYNESYNMLAGLTFWMTGYSMENSERYEKTFNTGIDNCFAIEKFEKNNKHGELTFAVGYRFLLSITGDNLSNTDILKDAAKSMNLKELSNK